MLWSDGRNTDPAELSRCVRNLVALSTLPAVWNTLYPHGIADSIAMALLTALDADFVHLSLDLQPDDAPQEVTRTNNEALAQQIMAALKVGWSKPHTGQTGGYAGLTAISTEQGIIRILSSDVGLGGRSFVVVGSTDQKFPTGLQQFLLGFAVDQAGIALHRWCTETDERRFQALVGQCSDLIAFSNLEGMPLYINPAGLRLLGLDEISQVMRCSILEYVHPAHRLRAAKEIAPLVKVGGHWIGELSCRHFGTGAEIPALVDVFCIEDPRTGSPMNFACVGRDLRPQKEAERVLCHLIETLEQRVGARTRELETLNTSLVTAIAEHARADARLQELQLELFHAARLSAVGQMAATLAHELNQPLTAATNSINAARILLDGGRDQIEVVQDVMGEASQQTLMAGAIVHRIRDFIRQGTAEKNSQGVTSIIHDSLTLVSMGAENLGVRISLDLDPRIPTVFMDRIQVQQVLTNLIRNAKEAMRHSERRELRLTTRQIAENTVEFAVMDTGAGMSAETRERLFEPFFSTTPSGMGLGLSICRSIVEAHGGKLRADQNRSGGTTFRFTLPIQGNG